MQHLEHTLETAVLLGGLGGLLVLAVMGPITASLLRLSLSRSREFELDPCGAGLRIARLLPAKARSGR